MATSGNEAGDRKSRRQWVPYALLLGLTWVAHFFFCPTFGLYDDDHHLIGLPLYQQWTWDTLCMHCSSILKGYYHGRPLHLVLALSASYVSQYVGGVGALYVGAFLVVAANACLFYRLLCRQVGRPIATLAACLLILSPATTAHQFLHVCFGVMPALTLTLAAANLYAAGYRWVAYLVAAPSVLIYETFLLPLVALPLLAGRWDRRWARRAAAHVMLVCGLLAGAFLVRLYLGEQRLSGAAATPGESFNTAAQLVKRGPVAAVRAHINRPVPGWKQLAKGAYFESVGLSRWAVYLAAGLGVLAVGGLILGPLRRPRASTQPAPAVIIQQVATTVSGEVGDRRGMPACAASENWTPEPAHPSPGAAGNRPAPGPASPAAGSLLWNCLRGAAAGAVMAVCAYPLLLNRDPGAVVGRASTVHLAALPGVALFLASAAWLVLGTAARVRALRPVVALLLCAYLGGLVSHHLSVQRDYARAWIVQGKFWTQVAELCADSGPDTVILYPYTELDSQTQLPHTFLDFLVLRTLDVSGTAGAVGIPAHFTQKAEIATYPCPELVEKDGRAVYNHPVAGPLPVGPGTIIYLVRKPDGTLTRLFGELKLGTQTVQLRPQGTADDKFTRNRLWRDLRAAAERVP